MYVNVENVIFKEHDDGMKIPVTQRLKELRTRANISMAQMASALELKGGSSYQRYEDETLYQKPYLPLDKVELLADYIVGKGTPEITEAEVMALAGLPKGNTPAKHPSIQDHTKPEVIEVLGEEYAAVTRWDIRASAGGGALIPDAPDALHRILFRMQWLRSMTRAPLENIFAVEVEGDSMEPTLRQGDLVLVDTSRRDPGSDSIFLLDDGELKVKRVQRDPRTQLLVIRSDNPHYEDFRDVPPENINIVGRVFWIARHF